MEEKLGEVVRYMNELMPRKYIDTDSSWELSSTQQLNESYREELDEDSMSHTKSIPRIVGPS